MVDPLHFATNLKEFMFIMEYCSRIIKFFGIAAFFLLNQGIFTPSFSSDLSDSESHSGDINLPTNQGLLEAAGVIPDSEYSSGEEGSVNYDTSADLVLLTEQPRQKSYFHRVVNFFADPRKSIPILCVATLTTGGVIYYFYSSHDENAGKNFHEPHSVLNLLDWIHINPYASFAECYTYCSNGIAEFFSRSPYSQDVNNTVSVYNIFDKNGLGHLYYGNFSDFVTKVSNEFCECTHNWTHFFEPMLNGENDPQVSTCFPNDNGNSICCGNGWPRDAWKIWGRKALSLPYSNFSIKMANASLECVQSVSEQIWKTNMIIAGSVGGTVTAVAGIFSGVSYYVRNKAFGITE